MGAFDRLVLSLLVWTTLTTKVLSQNTTLENNTTAAPTTTNGSSPLPDESGMMFFSASYVGRFQQILSMGCMGPPPAVVLVCQGIIDITGTSDPSIACRSETIQLGDGRSAMLCENVCIDGGNCDYLTADTIDGGNPFGEVFFDCRGVLAADVDAAVIIPRSEPGACDGNTTDGNSAIAYLAQLGVSCPLADGTQGFVVDDRHSGCGIDNRPLSVDGHYTCYTGSSCGAGESCEITFEQLVVNADPFRFQECIESSDGSPVTDIVPPEQPYREDGTFSASFRAQWFFLFGDDCDGSVSPKTITCVNGYIKPTSPFVEGDHCRLVTNSTIECVGGSMSASFDYECSSYSEIPETTVDYAAGTAGCNSTSDRLVQRAIQLGVKCGDQFVYDDLFLECGEGDAFALAVGENGDGQEYYTCLSSMTVPANSGNATYSIDATNVLTDYRWPVFASDQCYTFEEGDENNNRQRDLSSGNRGLSELDLVTVQDMMIWS